MSQQKPSWAKRNAVVFSALIFCAGILTYLTGWGEDTRLNETIAQFAWITGGGVIGAYVFGAAWEDISLWRG